MDEVGGGGVEDLHLASIVTPQKQFDADHEVEHGAVHIGGRARIPR